MKRLLPRGFSGPVLLGEGGFGIVYRAYHPRLDRNVVIKILPRRSRADRERILREAVTMGRLHLACVPQVYDAFVKQGKVCLIMQWIRGIDLATFLRSRPPLEHRREVAEGVLRALAALHQAGCAHRDLKPGNIIISPLAGPTLVDFGLARHTNDRTVTRANVIGGTYGFLAPELLKQADQPVEFQRADVYSAGMVLKQLFGEDNESSVVSLLTRSNPGDRPANASEALRHWPAELSPSGGDPDWESIAETATRNDLSEKLVRSARRLAEAGQLEQAYRLGLECLRENPDSPGGLKLMSDFSGYARSRRRRTVLFRLAAGGALACIVSALLVLTGGRDRELIEAIQAESNPQAVTSHLSRSEPPPAYDGVEFRFTDPPIRSLRATLQIFAARAGHSYFLDGSPLSLDSTSGRPIVLRLPPGAYRLSAVSPDDAAWSYRIEVLPFQQCRINASAIETIQSRNANRGDGKVPAHEEPHSDRQL